MKRKDKQKVRREKKEKFLRQERRVPRLESQSEAQYHYMKHIRESIITFGVGSAGTGKTYVATAIAGQMLYEGKIDKIIITRPSVESGKGLGFLPGTLEEKFAPYIAPVKAVLTERFGEGWFDCQLRKGNIEAVPLEFMMGKTFDKSFVLADEMQNSTPKEMFILLSRVGEYSKVVVNGDYKMQQVIKGESGLRDAIERLGSISDISVFKFSTSDIVRSGIAKKIIKRYED